MGEYRGPTVADLWLELPRLSGQHRRTINAQNYESRLSQDYESGPVRFCPYP